MNRRVALAVALAAAGGAVTWFALRPSDESLIRERAERLAKAVSSSPDDNIIFRTAQVKSEFGALLAPYLSVTITELPTMPSSRDDLVGVVLGTERVHGRGTVQLDGIEITLDDGKRAADVHATARLSRASGLLRNGQARDLRLHFDKVDDAWLVSRVVVTPTDR